MANYRKLNIKLIWIAIVVIFWPQSSTFARNLIVGLQIKGVNHDNVKRNVDLIHQIILTAPFEDRFVAFDLNSPEKIFFIIDSAKSKRNARFVRAPVDRVLRKIGTEYYHDQNPAPVVPSKDNPTDRFNVIDALDSAYRFFDSKMENILILFSTLRHRSDHSGIDFRNGYPSDAYLFASESDFTHLLSSYKVDKKYKANVFVLTNDSYRGRRLYLNKMARFYHYLFQEMGGKLLYFSEPVFSQNMTGEIGELLAAIDPDKNYSLSEPLDENGLLQIAYTHGFTFTSSMIKVDWNETADIDLHVKFKTGAILDYLHQTAPENLWVNNVSMRHSRNTALKTEQVVGFFNLNDLESIKLHFVSGVGKCTGVVRYFEGMEEKASSGFAFNGSGGRQTEKFDTSNPNWKIIDLAN